MTISLEQIDLAIAEALKGKSVTLGDTSYTRQDVDRLQSLREKVAARAGTRGRSLLDRAFLGGVRR